MKKKLLLITLSVALLSGCKWERDYNELVWKSQQKSVEIEILQKQIIIDSLKRHDVFKTDTIIIPKDFFTPIEPRDTLIEMFKKNE